MTQIFSTIPALPDDEQAFKRHQREQAKRRLHIQKGAAIDTNAKIHERNAATNYKSSLRAKQQTDPMEWDNSLQKVTEESLFDAEYEKEEQTIEKKMLTLPPVVILDEEPQVNTVDETKQQLQAIYEIHCPEKVNRIDALLQRYTGVEQQFLEYVREKYRSVTNQEASNIPVNAEVSNINRIEEKVSLLLNEGKESGPLRRRRVKQLRIPQHPPFRTPSTGPLGNITVSLLLLSVISTSIVMINPLFLIDSTSRYSTQP